MEQLDFQRASLRYVFLLQEVHERKKFEFVETILGFMYGWLTFYHQGHEVAQDSKPFMIELQDRLQKTRENFIATRDETETLMNKMLEVRKTKGQDSGSLIKTYARQGYLFLMEKKAFGTTWTKYYCLYQKQNRQLTMIPYTQTTGKITATDTLTLKSCVRRSSDSIEKRFCFDITAEDRQGVATLQALSDEDRKLWLDAMDGKEPTYNVPSGRSFKPEESFLDETGFAFVRSCISVLEGRGLEDQGLYRLVGVSSKVNKLIQMGLDRRKSEKLNFDDALEWENKTVTSALKTYFRNLPEPLLTFKLHSKFIAAAKLENCTQRVNHVHYFVHQLPKINVEMLEILMKHLCNVAGKCEKNLMTVSNLGVCFGPTLLRPEEESVAAIMDIKFCNIVVEILIEHHEKIFKTMPSDIEIQKQTLCQPAKPQHSSLTQHCAKQLVTQVNAAVVTAFQTEVPTSVNMLGIPPPSMASQAIPVPPARQKANHAKPLIIHNPLVGPEATNHQGSNSSSSTESVNSRSSSRDCNNHLSPSSSPVTGGRPNVHTATNYRPAEQVIAKAKKRHSVDSILTSSLSQFFSASTNSLSTSSLRTVRTLYHCEGENVSELSFEPNQIITNVRPSREPGWVEGTLNGKTGLIPRNYIEYLP